MFTRKPKPRSKLDQVIDVVLDEMLAETYASDDYKEKIEQLTKLYKLKEQETRKPPSLDTVMIVAANLVGIVLIIGHERAHVVTTKALGFVMRLK